MWAWITLAAFAVALSSVSGAGAGAARLICYVDNASADSFSECTHLVYAGNARGDKLDTLLKEYKKNNPGIKIVLRVSEADKDLRTLLKSKHIQGLEIHNAHSSLNRTKVVSSIEEARSALTAAGSGPLFLSLPGHPELLAKYYDLRVLVKIVDQMMLETDALGAMKKMTYHPSRLSGMWDMMNTDSVVDLVIGLGVPASKVVISLSATAHQFKLVNETLSTPGSPTEEDQPREIDQPELCRQLQKGRWTLERDQDLSAPYAFQNKTWISFEDSSSVDVKGKYARIRGLAGLALKKADRDLETPCGPSLKAALAKVLNQQSRAPRALVLRSLESEILAAPGHARALDALQVSPYRITQVVDSDGVIHSIREDTRTEFSCSRQGYFVHPRTCARFYRCVKFDQLSPDYTVFEFDCPAGLAFDSRYEVCVWPGSLADSQACPGSSEIAPVPQTRFVCPSHEGYYADPENCRWFFACLDHGKAPLTAYEFRCPFGLGFDAEKLKCDWPWLVPACGNIARYEAEAHGFSSAILNGAAGFHGQTANSINVAAHQSLVSGAALNNFVGIQGGYLSQADALDANFIASQELANSAGQTYQNGNHAQSNNGIVYSKGVVDSSVGLVQPTKYSGGDKYTSGSLILDDYRQPAGHSGAGFIQQEGIIGNKYRSSYNGANAYTGSLSSNGIKSYQANVDSYSDDSGAYVHDPTGDQAEPYRHDNAPAVPYIHDVSVNKQVNDYQDSSLYKHASQTDYDGKYSEDKSGQYIEDNAGAYYGEANEAYKSGYASSANGAYNADYSGVYNADYSRSYAGDLTGKYVAGVYQNGAQASLNGVKGIGSVNIQQKHENYAENSGAYLTDSKAYTGVSHTLAAGSVNVGLVGKTTLVDTAYNQEYYNNAAQNVYNSAFSQSYISGHDNVHQVAHNRQLGYVSQPAVSINHLGTDVNNLDGYIYHTTPTASVVPTTVTPIAVTTAIPVVTTTYRTAYIPQAPKTSMKQVFGYSQPAVTYVQPAVVPVKQYVIPKIEGQVTRLYEAVGKNINTGNAVASNSESSGYNYSKPNVKFEEGISYPTAAPTVQAVDYQYYENNINSASAAVAKSETSGYNYPNPSVKFEEGISYTTADPAVQYVSTYQPQAYNHQTIHQQSVGYGYSTPAPTLDIEEPFKKVVAYTTSPQVFTYAQPTVPTYSAQSFSDQTVHHVNADKVVAESNGYEYKKPAVGFEEQAAFVQHTTVQPTVAVQSNYQPQIFSQQTLHNVDASQVTINSRENTGYDYPKPALQFVEAPKQTVEVSTLKPAVEYKPQLYSQKTIHQSHIPAVQSNYQPQTFNQQTLHNFDDNQFKVNSQKTSGYDYPKPAVKFVEVPKQIVEVSTVQPAVEYKPQSYSQKTILQSYVPVSSKPKAQLQYQQPAVSYYENPILKYTLNATPVTYVKPTPDIYTQEHYQPIVQQHEIKHISQPIQYEAVQNYNHNVQNQGYVYNQPEIQRDVETFNTGSAYSLASEVSHQVFHESEAKSQYDYGNKNVVYVSSTPANLAYEDHYAEYETPKKAELYQAPEYIPPKTESQIVQTVATILPPVVQKVETYQAPEYIPPKNDYLPPVTQKVEMYQAPEYIPPKNEYQTVHTFSPPVVQKTPEYIPPRNVYQPSYSVSTILPPVVPKIETYQAPDYLPPKTVYEESYIASTTAKPIVHQQQYYTTKKTENQYNYNQGFYQQYDISQKTIPLQQVSFSTSHIEQPKKVESFHISSFPGTSVTIKPDSNQIPEIQEDYQEEYLSPVVSIAAPVVTSTFAERTYSPTTFAPRTYSSTKTREYLPPTSKPEEKNREYLPPKVDNTYLPPSTTTRTIYKSTTFKAPEYLPPQDESKEVIYESFGIKSNPYDYSAKVETVTRKQNIVIQTAKANLLGYGTVGPDAGLVSPGYLSTTESYSSTPYTVSSTNSPVKQGLVEINRIPARKTRPKVAVVTKINDFNPLLVRKLGAVCSCQSPVVVLKGKRPTVQSQPDYDVDYGNDYEDNGRGDIGASDFVRTSGKLSVPAKIQSYTVAPVTSTSFNPIIVPDDSYYQDISEPSHYNVAITPKSKEVYSESYVSSTPATVSSTEKIYTIRPRNKAVTIAPTYKTVLLKEIIPTLATVVEDVSDSHASAIESQTFDRYGPGGLRSRDETLQGSVDCQRAGLFRHPKQCNKFYACRWDCTKQRFTLHIFNCPIQLSFDPSIGACNWPSQGPACQGDTLLTNTV